MLDVTITPILEDNYAYILQSGNEVAIVDPGEAKPIIQKLEEMNLKPSIIFNTHHHWDHVNGNKEIKEKYGTRIIGPAKENIPETEKSLDENNNFSFDNDTIEIIETPGHTNGHICLYFPKSKILFSGDTLFAMGCGRLFEGTAEDMFKSFEKLKQLPDDVTVYCGHEYTLGNGEFCLSVEPDNADLIERMNKVRSLRASNTPTIPTSIELEKKTNVFMRAKNAEEFKKYRDLKDDF